MLPVGYSKSEETTQHHALYNLDKIDIDAFWQFNNRLVRYFVDEVKCTVYAAHSLCEVILTVAIT